MRKAMARILLLVLLLSLTGCGKKTVPLETVPIGQTGGRLLCQAESEEAALELARLYGIELLEFRHGLAVFTTEEDLQTVIRRGREQGLPELTPDGISTTS